MWTMVGVALLGLVAGALGMRFAWKRAEFKRGEVVLRSEAEARESGLRQLLAGLEEQLAEQQRLLEQERADAQRQLAETRGAHDAQLRQFTESRASVNGQTLQNSWNASITGTSGTLTARPNGAGNNFGITVYKNGNNNTPTATCSLS